MRKSTSKVLLALLAFLFFGCENNKETTSGIYQHGVFIVNEGPFNSGTGTIGFFERSSKTMTNSIFEKVNNRPLGNIVQSISFHNNKGYIVVNNANKIEVVEEGTFESVAAIENLPMPRYFLGISQEKAYVSCWGTTQGEIKIIDLNSNTISGSIPLITTGADGMVKIGNKVFVVSTGGFGSNNRISVIDAANDQLIGQIISEYNPNSILTDSQGKLWVSCSGKKVYDPNTWAIITDQSTNGAILQINPDNHYIIKRFEFENIYDSPSNLTISQDGNNLYYLLGFGVFRLGINDNQLPEQPIIAASFYGLGFDPSTEYLHAADAGNFTSAGKMLRYTANGVPVDTFSVGIVPNSFYFK
jgi:hypothetical protein